MSEKNPLSIGVFGLGHVGLPTALGFSELGWNVIGVESDPKKAQLIKNEDVPFNEIGVAALLKKHSNSGKFSVTTDTKLAVKQADILFMCVGTPKRADGSADTSQLEQLARELHDSIASYKIVIQKSTAPVNTSRKIKDILVGGKNDGHDVKSNRKIVDVVVIPEFLREGRALEDFFNPKRIVVGLDNPELRPVIIDLYRPLLEKIKQGEDIFVFTDLSSAEIAKHTANAFLATKISFINMIADLCAKVEANVETVAKVIGMDPRIGTEFLRAGIGFGGECLPKDLSAFIQIGKNNGLDFSLLEAVEKVNNDRVNAYLSQVVRYLGELGGKTLAVWGLAFKPNTDDVRNSQSVAVIQRLVNQKVRLQVHDPYAVEEFKRRNQVSDLITFCESPIEAAHGAHAILILTDWPQYSEEDFSKLCKVMKTPIIFDGRNTLDPSVLHAAGFQYHGIGLGNNA
ncbi:MAG: UDP-glucose 6-dehydrogenase [Dehalococcoidia bacterium]|nr:UDP-glucose 6-dehydrogenase [Dehalococcoidia bacterium]|tara:strand:+ start:12581 stop:13951 length:1371 start_codon:yes stop_codon:yes gene_type:complete